MKNLDNYTQIVKKEALRLGFDYCGIAKAERLNEDAKKLESWLKNGFHSGMQWMENNFEARIDPTILVSGAKSVITLMFNYYPEQIQNPNHPKIAKYAYGNDYHTVIKLKLNEFLNTLNSSIGAINGRGFVDSAPILERAWAVKSGLGWVGKNSNLINKKSGSFFFIATLITDLNLIFDSPFSTDHCGTCTRCIDACPTEAIISPALIDSQKCISYLTIELKDELIPEPFKNSIDNWLFGCDVCQDVCPWNRFSKPTHESSFKPLSEVLNFTKNDWIDLEETSFKILFKNSPIKRAKWKGIQRNLSNLK